MYVSPRLYVGRAPDWAATTTKHASNGQEASHLVKQGFVTVVPTTDVAYEALILMGSSPEHALRATTPPSPLSEVLDFGADSADYMATVGQMTPEAKVARANRLKYKKT